jgi:hypothetical protein
MTKFEYKFQRWQIAVEGKPVGPVFDNWPDMAREASRRGLAVIEPLAALGSKEVVLVHKKPFESWMEHEIAEYELSEII